MESSHTERLSHCDINDYGIQLKESIKSPSSELFYNYIHEKNTENIFCGYSYFDDWSYDMES